MIFIVLDKLIAIYLIFFFIYIKSLKLKNFFLMLIWRFFFRVGGWNLKIVLEIYCRFFLIYLSVKKVEGISFWLEKLEKRLIKNSNKIEIRFFRGIKDLFNLLSLLKSKKIVLKQVDRDMKTEFLQGWLWTQIKVMIIVLKTNYLIRLIDLLDLEILKL